MSDTTGVFKPKSFAIRNPLDNKRTHGSVVNPPRKNELSGKMTSAHDKNDQNLVKPGGTKSSTRGGKG